MRLNISHYYNLLLLIYFLLLNALVEKKKFPKSFCCIFCKKLTVAVNWAWANRWVTNSSHATRMNLITKALEARKCSSEMYIYPRFKGITYFRVARHCRSVISLSIIGLSLNLTELNSAVIVYVITNGYMLNEIIWTKHITRNNI